MLAVKHTQKAAPLPSWNFSRGPLRFKCVAAVWVRNEHELAFALAIDRQFEVVRLDVTML